MENLFINILNMSLSASFVIVAVLVIRLLMKRAPKAPMMILWLVVLFRLLVPFTLKLPVNLMPVNSQPIPKDIVYQQTPEIDSGLKMVDQVINPILPAATLENSVNPMQIWLFVGALIWFLGMVVLLGYSLVSLALLVRRISKRGSRCVSGNIYEGEGLETAFVIGIIRPRIYLPAGLGEEERVYILRHEEMHIRRKDHIFRLAAFAALCVHWFNPLVWAAFLLMVRDMEMACDEAVLKDLGPDSADLKKAYSTSLLSLATGRRMIGGAPLAFGEGEVKGRVKNVLNYRKPVFWILILVCVVVAAAGICLLSGADESGTDESGTGGGGTGGSMVGGHGISVTTLSEEDMAAFSTPARYWYRVVKQLKMADVDGEGDAYHFYPLEERYVPEGHEGYLVYYCHGGDNYSWFELTAKKQKGMLNVEAVEHDAVNDHNVSSTVLAMVTFPEGDFGTDQILAGGNEAETMMATEAMTRVSPGKVDWSVLLDAPDGAISQDVITALNDMFSTGCEVEPGVFITNPNALHCIARTFFESPEMLNFASFMRHFPLKREISAEEGELLESWSDWPFAGMTIDDLPVPIHKYTSEDIDQVLDFYLGITLKDLPEDMKEQLLYFEKSDSYYNFTSDYGPGVFRVVAGEKKGDTVVLYGDGQCTVFGEDGLPVSGKPVMTLKEVDGRYLIRSFMPES